MALTEDPAASIRGLPEEVDVVLRRPRGRGGPAEDEREGSTRLHGQVAQALVVRPPQAGFAVLFVGDLEQAGSQAAHAVHEGAHLAPVCLSAGDGLVVRCLVVGRARGRQPERAGPDRVFEVAAHGGHVVVGPRLLEGALAHHVRPQRRVTHVPGVVDALLDPLDGVEIVGEGLPLPADPLQHGFPGDVLGPLETAHDQVLVGLGARGQREAAIAQDGRGDPVPRRAGAERVPEHLGVHMGMDLDEAGRHEFALGIDLLGASFTDPADGGDAAVLHADVGAVPGPP